MKLLKKATTMASVVFLLAIALVSCKEKIDVYGPMEGMAEENIPNSYSCTVVDSANFTVTIYEYTFVSGGDSTDNSGTYTVAMLTGDGKVTSEVKAFTYKRGPRNADNISYDVYLTYADGVLDTVKWGAASITDKKYLHSGPKRAENLAKIIETLPNRDWTFEKVNLYVDDIHDTIAFVRFTSVVDYLTDHEIDSINAWLTSAEGKAAKAWWNANYELVGATKNDTVKLKGDTVRVFRNLVENGGYKSQFYHWALDTIELVNKDTVGVKDSTYIYFKLNFVEGQPNVGSYYSSLTEYGRKYYDEGDIEAEKTTIVDLSFAHWGVAFNGSLLNAKNFAIIAQEEGSGEMHTYLLSGLDAKKGQFTLDKKKFSTPIVEE